MASSNSLYFHLLKAIVFLLILSLTTSFATSTRILDEEVASPTGTPNLGPDPGDQTPISATTPGVSIPGAATAATGPNGGAVGTSIVPGVSTPGGAATITAPIGGAGSGAEIPDHTLTFFMHDILGGSNPSAIAVTGVVTNPAVSGQVPFAKPNGAVLPINNGNSGIVNNNNVPFLTGLSGTAPNLLQNNGNNIIGGGSGFPALNMAQLPTGTTFQKLMFGTMTVFDDELTEGHELGSGLVGKAQGFYIASSEDGTSQTMAFTVMFTSGSYADSLSFFGIHRTASSESHLAIMGGTGKYVNAKGLATVKTFPVAIGAQNTDGVETLLEITVYLAY